ncbi:MAG: hypothetical protein M1134_00530 [Actinobacteria bacterium]|nr:hypothetical protein [Actinomycetota bacterium]
MSGRLVGSREEIFDCKLAIDRRKIALIAAATRAPTAAHKKVAKAYPCSGNAARASALTTAGIQSDLGTVKPSALTEAAAIAQADSNNNGTKRGESPLDHTTAPKANAVAASINM